MQADPPDSYIEFIAMQRVANFISESRNRRNGQVTFKLLTLEKMYIDYLASHDIYKGSNTTRFYANLKTILKNIQPVVASGNVGYVFLSITIKENVIKEDTITEELSILKKAALILRKSLKGKTCEFGGSLKESFMSCNIPNGLEMFLSILIKNSPDKFSPNYNTLAQLIMYNMVLDISSGRSKEYYHTTKREPPIPLYVGLKIYAKTRSNNK